MILYVQKEIVQEEIQVFIFLSLRFKKKKY